MGDHRYWKSLENEILCRNEMGQPASVGMSVNEKNNQNHYRRRERHASQQRRERNRNVLGGTTERQICSVSDCLHVIAKRPPKVGK